MSAPIENEIREIIRRKGPITFAEFMQICLYSPNGGFYFSRGTSTSHHFGTSPTTHPAFGALIARQLEQMWRILGSPPVFHLVEVGSGDGQLSRSIAIASRRTAPRFADALRYVASDYQPGTILSPASHFDQTLEAEEGMHSGADEAIREIQTVKGEGLRPFKKIVGCVLCNELVDNFPVHRFAVQDGKVKEVFVAFEDDKFIEVIGEPSKPRIAERLAGLDLKLAEGYRGEVNLGLEDWTDQIATALERGFVLTIDYGELATDLYSTQNAQGTLVCYRQHTATDDPYRRPGEQDITCQVDFTSLMRLGDFHELSTVGFTTQRSFLENLGFSSLVDRPRTRAMSAARAELDRLAMMTLVDPEEYGNFKVMAQAKRLSPGQELLGFRKRRP